MFYAFLEESDNHIKSDINFGKNVSISWDDSAILKSNNNIVYSDINNYVNSEIENSIHTNPFY
ncbi:hypothetical protein ESOMN_v1c04960 [Williamsoniiplasma somnilux]|uniref:Uncharacterized protein n=2 Tax=Williamsoniiplasma somnilux TaxID=215578 RepID=A0A2K8P0A4_9MOLU|nr:hypothetical protein ESOMN_v1c04960 [Williamsoniiplasma somnilux]